MTTSRIKSWIAVWSAVLTTMAVNGAPRTDQAKKGPEAKPDQIHSGMVVSVDPKDNLLNVKGFLFSHKEFNLGNNCTYILVGQNPGALADVRLGQRVTVSYRDVHGVLVADHVTQQALRDKGMVKAIDPAAHSMTVHLGLLMNKTFQVPAGCQVTLHGDKSGAVGDIHVGDHVTVTYEVSKGKATAREIAQTSATFTGTMTAIDLDQKIIKAQTAFSTRKFNLADDCTIVVNGKPDGKLTDLRPGEKLTFNYENVDGVNVVNRIAPAGSQRSAVASTTPPPGNFKKSRKISLPSTSKDAGKRKFWVNKAMDIKCRLTMFPFISPVIGNLLCGLVQPVFILCEPDHLDGGKPFRCIRIRIA